MNLDSIMQMIQANAVIITAASVLTVLVLFFLTGKAGMLFPRKSRRQ